jgi:hypothetical protein
METYSRIPDHIEKSLISKLKLKFGADFSVSGFLKELESQELPDSEAIDVSFPLETSVFCSLPHSKRV